MQAPSGSKSFAGNPSSRVRELGIVLPAPPTPLGAYVESSETGNLLFLSGLLPVVNGKLAVSGRLGENLSVKEGQEAAHIASLNALAVAKEHLGTLDRLKKLVKLTVLIATTEGFTDHAPVADGASNLFVQIFGPEAGHTRLVYGVQSLPIAAPLMVDVVFEIKPASWKNMNQKRKQIPIHWKQDVQFEKRPHSLFKFRRIPALIPPRSPKEISMPKVHPHFTAQDSTMKALIIYDDFACAVKAYAALRRSAENVDFAAQWIVKPWRVDMLKFPPTAEEALTDAIDVHLIVFAGRTAEYLPFWLLNWLEHWAKCRRIDGASLAAIDSERINTFAAPATIELGSFAKRHGLSFVRDEGEVVKGNMMPSLQVAIMDPHTTCTKNL